MYGDRWLAGRGPKHTTLPSPQTAQNGAQRSVHVFPFMSVTVRRSVDTCDDEAVSEYEVD